MDGCGVELVNFTTCPDCKGDNVVGVERFHIDYINGGDISVEYLLCETCGGTGLIEGKKNEGE